MVALMTARPAIAVIEVWPATSSIRAQADLPAMQMLLRRRAQLVLSTGADYQPVQNPDVELAATRLSTLRWMDAHRSRRRVPPSSTPMETGVSGAAIPRCSIRAAWFCSRIHSHAVPQAARAMNCATAFFLRATSAKRKFRCRSCMLGVAPHRRPRLDPNFFQRGLRLECAAQQDNANRISAGDACHASRWRRRPQGNASHRVVCAKCCPVLQQERLAMVLSHSPRADSRLVVVTGANGFIGQALCAHFVANGRPHRRIVRALPEGAAAAADTVVLGDLASASEEGLAAALTVRLRWCTLRRGSTCRARPAGIRR